MVRWDRVATLFIALVGTWPFAGAFWGRIPGDRVLPVDGAHTAWVYEVVRSALAGNDNLLHTLSVWYPTGQSLLLAEQNLLDAFLAAPFLTALGTQHGMAAFVLLVLIGNAIAAGWLGELVGGRGLPGPVAASIVAFCPFIWGETYVGRYTQSFLLPSVLAMAVAWKAAHSGRQGGVTGIMLGTTGLAYWFYGAFAATLVGGLFAGAIATARPVGPMIKTLALAAGIPLLVAAVPAAFIAATWSAMPGANTQNPMPVYTRFAGGLPWAPTGELIAYIPQLLVIPAVILLVSRPTGPTVGLAVATALLACTAAGDFVRIGTLDIPTPLAAIRQVPGLDRFWWPHRALGAVTLGLAALVARSAALPGRLRWLAVTAAALSAVQASWNPVTRGSWVLPPRPAWDTALPPGPVVILPLRARDPGKRMIAEWTTHHRPLVNGKSMWEDFLWPENYRRWFTSQPLLSSLLAVEDAHGKYRHVPRGRNAAAAKVEFETALRAAFALDGRSLAGLREVSVVGFVAGHADTPRELFEILNGLCGDPATDGNSSWWVLSDCSSD